MKITGKCKQEFWISLDRPTLEGLDSLPESCQNALIIEFFDSVGIYVFIAKRSDTIWKYNIDDGEEYPDDYGFETRPEATNAAIEKANEIFNLNNK